MSNPHRSGTVGGNMPAAGERRQHDYFDDEVDANPEQHFLSPIHMYEYEDWAEDSDEDEIEWDAGITDFALFENDRRRAEETGTSVPSRWADLVTNQASAMQRSIERTRQTPDGVEPSVDAPGSIASLGCADAIPDLTPDNSPDLRDDLEEAMAMTSDAQQEREYDAEDEDEIDQNDDEELLFSLHAPRKVNVGRSRPGGRLQRPGLRHSRTLSGQAHVWKWPSVYIPPVSEDVDGEICAERDDVEAGASADDGQLWKDNWPASV